MGKCQKNGHTNFKKNVKKKKSWFFTKLLFIPESFNIQLSENDDSTCDSKYAETTYYQTSCGAKKLSQTCQCLNGVIDFKYFE